MKLKKLGTLTWQFDPSVPALYIYLREVDGFRSYKTKRISDDVNVDLDAEGHLIGVEMLSPGSLNIVFTKVMPKYKANVLKQLESKREEIERLLQPA